MTNEHETLTTRKVIDRHLALRMEGALEQDLQDCYDPDVVLLSYEGVHHGLDGVRTLAGILRSYTEASSYVYEQVLAERDVAMLRWRTTTEDVRLGVDSYVVRNGRIVAQTIYFTTADGAGS